MLLIFRRSSLIQRNSKLSKLLSFTNFNRLLTFSNQNPNNNERDFNVQDIKKHFYKKQTHHSASQHIQRAKLQKQQEQFNKIFTPLQTSQQTKEQHKQKFKLSNAQFKNLQKSALDLSQPMHTAMTWIQECSYIDLKQNLMIRDYNHINGMGYGLQVVEKDVQKQTVIMRVPITSCIIPQKLKFQCVKEMKMDNDDDSKQQQKQQYKNIEILSNIIIKTAEQCCEGLKSHPSYSSYRSKLESILFLTLQVLTYDMKPTSSQQMIKYMISKQQNKAEIIKSFSLFGNYSNSWPRQDMTNIIYWGPNVVLKIRSNFLIQFRSQVLMQSDQIYQAFIKNYKKEMNIEQKKQLEIISPDSFKWAFNTARSRHIPQCQFFQMKMQKTPFIIAPLIDYINHPPDDKKSNVRIELQKDGDVQFVNVVSTQKIPRGDQLYMDYGKVCSSQYLNKYGFMNQFRDDAFANFEQTKILAKFNLNNEFQSILREQIDLKQKVLQNYEKFGIKQVGGFQFRLISDYEDELKYLRLMLMSAEDLYLQKISNQDVLEGKIDFTNKLTRQELLKSGKIRLRDEHEYRVIKVFESTLMDYYRPFSQKTKIQKQDWRKVQTIEGATLNYVHSFEQCEKRILENAKNFMKNTLIK